MRDVQIAATSLRHLRAGLIAALALIALGIAYAPALAAGFVWDDDAHLTAPALRSTAGLWRIWAEPGATQQYYPALHSVFWFQHHLWGNAPLGYHLANIIWHVTAAVLLAHLLRRLQVPGALMAAALFALHPVHVESVAWISEQKNTLSTVFYLAAALWYVRFDATRERHVYVIAFAFFLLALLTKTVTATLPAGLLVVGWWRRGHLSLGRDVRPLIPWLVLGASAGLFTAWVEQVHIGAQGAVFDLTWVQRCLLAGRAAWFYFGKLLWPANLSFIYPRWAIDAGNPADWLPLLTALGLLAGCWCSRTRAPLAVALLFVGTLFPALGFLNVYPFQYSFVADHFQYLASIPIFAALGALLAWLPSAVAAFRVRTWPGVTAVLLLAPLALLGREQSRTYRDNLTLFRATISRNPASWMAHNNLGKELMSKRERLPEAVGHFEQALLLHPEYPEARNNLGLALTQLGRPHEAIPHFDAALRLKPGSYQTHNNLGIALASSGEPLKALESFARAAALNPSLSNIQENWAKALLLLGRDAEAQEKFTIAAQLRRADR